jgi:hypothetical protein
MLSEDIEAVDRYVKFSPVKAPVREKWQRIKTALAELGTTPNTAITPCKYCGCGSGHMSWCQSIGGSGKLPSSTAQ